MGVDFGLPHFDLGLEELSQLALTAGLKPVAKMTCKRKAPDAALFVGSGKADEIKFMAEQMGAKEVLFDQYVVLLRNTVTQMVYKHAISTIVPGRAVNLSGSDSPDEPVA